MKRIPRRPPITMYASNGKLARIRNYILKNGICKVPRGILARLGDERGFGPPDYWTHGVTKDGTNVGIVGFIVGSERGKLSGKDYTTVEQHPAFSEVTYD